VLWEDRRGEDESEESNDLFVCSLVSAQDVKHDSVQDKMTEYNIGPSAGKKTLNI